MERPEDMIWTSYYAPRELSDVILPKRVHKKLEGGVYNNLLFHGDPGVGKTLVSKIMAKDHEHLYFNASRDSGVDNLRRTVTEFASTLSLTDEGRRNKKIIILDEMDGVSDQYMKALRGVVEEFISTTRFIATCNYYQNIPDPIRSRFEPISFDWDDEEEKEVKREMGKRILGIARENGMDFDKKGFTKFLERNFPDMRRMISSLQGFYNDGVVTIDENVLERFHGTFKELFEKLFESKDKVDNYKYLSQYKNRVDDIISALGEDLIDFIIAERPEKKSYIGEVCYQVNKHSYERYFAMDPFVTLLSLFYKLQEILNN